MKSQIAVNVPQRKIQGLFKSTYSKESNQQQNFDLNNAYENACHRDGPPDTSERRTLS